MSLWLGAMLVALWGGACAEQEAPTVQGRQEGAVGTPFDVSGVIHQVRRTFRPDAEGWSGGLATYSVRATHQGLTVTPFHQEEGSPVVEGTPVTFGPALLWRGDTRLDVAREDGEVQADGALALGQGEVREWLRNGEEGVEQSWEFAGPPSGEGELRVTLAVNGLEYVGETDRGLHFANPETHLGVRYGHGTWIDAEGRRTAVPARYVEGQVELRVPAEVVATSAWPAVLDPIISPERGVDQPVLGPANNAQSQPAVAAGAGSFLLVWQDYRRMSNDIYGARVDANGTLLDSTGIIISEAGGDQLVPAVAFDGTNFLVTWSDGRHGVGSIYAARVSGAGTVLEPSGLLVSRGSTARKTPSVAHNGTNYLIVWEEVRSSSNSDIYAARVSNAGSLLDATSRIVSNSTGHQIEPSVASGGGQFFVAWSEMPSGTYSWNVYGARVGGDGAVLGTAGIRLSPSGTIASAPAVAHDGTNYLVVWVDQRNGSADIYGTQVSPTGTVLNPSSIAIATGTISQSSPAVAHDGTRYLVVWKHGGYNAADLRGARVSNTGTVLDSAGFDIRKASNDQESPAVAGSAQAGFLVAWYESANGTPQDIFAARVSGDGVLRDTSGIFVSQASNAQEAPAAAWDGKNYLVVWKDNRNGDEDIYGVRVSAEGTPVESTGFPIARAVNIQKTPAVACNGTRCLVVWADLRGVSGYWDIYGARVDGNGVVLDPGGLAVSTATSHQMEPAVAFDGANFLVVWEDWRSGSARYIYGARVSVGGAVLDLSGFAVTASWTYTLQSTPVIASVGEQSLVVWADTRSGAEQIFARRVSQTGVPLGFADVQLSSGTGIKYNPAVAADPSSKGFLAVWENWGAYPYRLFATRVNANGNALNPGGVALVPTATSSQRQPAVAYDGTGFLMLWAEDRSGGSDIQGLYVGTDGKPVDAPFVVSAEAPYELAPVLASGAKDRVLVAYHVGGVSSSAPMRVRARTVSRVIPNVPPVADSRQLTTPEDQPLQLTLSGSDPEGKPLTYTLVSQPTRGTLTGVPPTLTYTPTANSSGTDSFTFTVNDGTDTSAPATVSLTVTPVNDVPVAYGQALTTAEDQSLALTLSGSDVEGSSLTYTVVSPPAHGTLSGVPPALTYTPAANYHGTDGFSFTVNDGTGSSTPATVSLTVTPVNDVPVAYGQKHTVHAGASLELTLTGSDVDGDALGFQVLSGPSVGTLSGTPPLLTYTAPEGFRGPVSFTFVANDGSAASAPATVSLEVYKPLPVVSVAADVLAPLEGQAVHFTSTVSAPGGGPVRYAWDFGDGTRSSEPSPTHVFPDEGPYQVTLVVSDLLDQVQTGLELSVRNADPLLPAQPPVAVDEGTAVTLSSQASDPGVGDVLTVTWDFGDGSAPATGLEVTHTYAEDGEYQVRLTVTDGDGGSASSLRTVVVRNTAPVPVPVARQEVWMGQKFSLRLSASDAAGDRDPLHWALVSGPGAVDSSGLYTWHATRAGEHTVTVRVSDDEGGSSLLVFVVRATPGRHLAKGHAELAAP